MKYIIRLIGDGDEYEFGRYLQILVEHILLAERTEEQDLFPETIDVVNATVKFIGRMWERYTRDETKYSYEVSHVTDKVNEVLQSLSIRVSTANQLSLIKTIEGTFGGTVFLDSLIKKSKPRQLIITKRDNGLSSMRVKGIKVLKIGFSRDTPLEETIRHLFEQVRHNSF